MPFLRDRLLGTDARGHGLLIAVVLCMVLGGSDLVAPWLDVVVQIGVAGLAAWWFCTAPRSQIAAIPLSAWVIVGMVVLLPLFQLVPLPPAVWHALPGRDLERQALDLVGQGDTWRPLSLTPDRTLAAALAMACGVIFVPMAAATDRGGRSRIMVAVVTVGVLSVLVGAQQIVGGADGFFQFFGTGNRNLHGFQWNRNSEADVLLLAMLGAAGCATELLRLPGMRRRRLQVLVLAGGLSVVFALGVVLTGSRTGIVLILPILLGQALIMAPHIRLSKSLLVLPVVALVAGAALWGNSVLVGALDHFHDSAELRPGIWTDSLVLVHRFMPLGGGLGSFAPLFAQVEQLDLLNPLYVAHAYEDYVQLAIEAGIPGLAALLTLVVILVLAAWRGVAAPMYESRAQHIFAVSALLTLAVHSAWDYPLHSPSLACLAACCVGMLLRPARTAEEKGAA
jgi:O-antigen ligase